MNISQLDPLFVGLVTVLTVAVLSDLRAHRIPNSLTATGAAAGLLLQSIPTGWEGLATGLLGALAGLCALLPFYVLKGMGAGDVKLAAAAGAFLAPGSAMAGALATLVVGGACALLWLGTQALRRSLPTPDRSGAAGLDAPGRARARFPYAIAIAIGMLYGALYGTSWEFRLP